MTAGFRRALLLCSALIVGCAGQHLVGEVSGGKSDLTGVQQSDGGVVCLQNECATDSECPSGNTCIELTGICVRSVCHAPNFCSSSQGEAPQAPGGNFQEPKTQSPCQSDTECQSGSCVVRQQESGCFSGTCEAPTTTDVDAGPACPSPVCQKDADCPTDKGPMECVSSTTQSGCVVSYCAQKATVPDAGTTCSGVTYECENDSQCGAGTLCVLGRHVQTGCLHAWCRQVPQSSLNVGPSCLPHHCGIDADCPDNKSCANEHYQGGCYINRCI